MYVLILTNQGVDRINHYAPLHYLPFIARSRALLGKHLLKQAGFTSSHLRSMSSTKDAARGFGGYVFLTLHPRPGILLAKLAKGFPHIGVSVPVRVVEEVGFSLCRFNVAMTRRLRRDGNPGYPESSANGRYYRDHQIPVARTHADKSALLVKHLSDSAIEVLIDESLGLPDDTRIICYSPDDGRIATSIRNALRFPWAIDVIEPPGDYEREPRHVKAIEEFIFKALADENWRGNGLEFDRLG